MQVIKYRTAKLLLLFGETKLRIVWNGLMSGMVSGSLSSVPHGKIIDFDRAELRRVPYQDSLYLWVSARTPGTSFELRLAPRIYHDRPDYWGIEVIAIGASHADNDSGAGAGDAVIERSVPLSGITGIKGISVIGASQTKLIEIDNGSV